MVGKWIFAVSAQGLNSEVPSEYYVGWEIADDLVLW